MVVSCELDHFNLGPIVELVLKSKNNHKRRAKESKESEDESMGWEMIERKKTISFVTEVEETSRDWFPWLPLKYYVGTVRV